MPENENKSEIPSFEMVVELPLILKEPLTLSNGIILNVGDNVEHSKFGKGKILRIWKYSDVGTCLYIDFGNNVKEQILPEYVRKIAP
jgi:hypothetical protein